MGDLTLALDIGGTKIAAGLVSPDGTLLTSRSLRTPRGDAEEVWAVVEQLADELGGEATGIGIASAGPVDLPAGTVAPINIPAWTGGFPLRDRVHKLLPALPVRMAGDGVCMALGEHRRGAGQGAQYMLGMVISTGVGGGLVFDGKPVFGRTGNAGHVGHVVVEPGGPLCACGARGCV
ncbi:MAG: ROK family protein, partial [Mycobacterium sp.]